MLFRSFPHSHYTFHHHCTSSTSSFPTVEGSDANGTSGGSSAPARFYFGPGFEPHMAHLQGSGGYIANQQPGGSAHGQEHIVLFHVNPGVTINFQIGDTTEVLRGKCLSYLFFDVIRECLLRG